MVWLEGPVILFHLFSTFVQMGGKKKKKKISIKIVSVFETFAKRRLKVGFFF